MDKTFNSRANGNLLLPKAKKKNDMSQINFQILCFSGKSIIFCFPYGKN